MAKKKTTKKASKKKSSKKKKTVATITHTDEKRTNIPTAEQSAVVAKEDKEAYQLKYPRNPDLDPQLVWRGKDNQDWSDLVVNVPPLYIQEKVHPKVLIDDLLKETKKQDDRDDKAGGGLQLDLFGDFNGLPDEARSTEFYQHEANWTNRMILGDSLQVMASLAEREGLRGKVQCIYIDPPYGIKFNSNFQWSTTSRDVKERSEHITREPEQVKAFRDTWRDGIHSYLTYLRDRLTTARDLLAETGSVFVQISDENVHRVRALMDEVFGDSNFLVSINYVTTSGFPSKTLTRSGDLILWYAKNANATKYRKLFTSKNAGDDSSREYKWLMLPDGTTRKLTELEYNGVQPIPDGSKRWRYGPLTSSGASEAGTVDFEFQNRTFHPGKTNHWKVSVDNLRRLEKAGLLLARRNSIAYYLYAENYPIMPITNMWNDTKWGFNASEKRYVVETNSKVVEKCILMATDPGDLVLDPTCGSGTTAFVCENWGRRWITIDSSRVALALARARVMGSKFPFYLLADSREGKVKESELTRTTSSETPSSNNIRLGFVNHRAPHITLGSIAHNVEIDVIWESFQEKMEPVRADLNKSAEQKWEEWEVPREAEEDWSDKAKKLHAEWWKLRIERQQEIDASIAAKADFEYLYDRPYEDKSKVRVAGPFTVESLSPHRTLGVDHDDELIDPLVQSSRDANEETDFATMVLDNLKTAGVQQSSKEDKIDFTSIDLWPGNYVCAVGRYMEGEEGSETEKTAGIFVGPEFGTVNREDLVAAAKECGEAGFDVLISCAFNYSAHASEFNKLGAVQVLKARMNADLHMAGELKNTGKGNLFVIFGEPDIEIIEVDGQFGDRIQVKIHGVDVFHPNTGKVISDSADGIACWFIDTDYNEESFFVRHAYFLGAGDPYKSLKTTLKSEINQEAWDTLYSDTSRPFYKPKSGRIAIKVINHLGDEVMKVFKVGKE
jgi:adenine-specific DNA-methyltransferase